MKSRLLVVDDDPETCELVQELLARHGHDVTIATSAAVALDKLALEDFDAVLTDLGMAEMDGLALCERILGARPEMPIIVVTGEGSVASAVAALRVGAYDFLTKPVDPALLAHSVQRAVQHRVLNREVKRLADVVGARTTDMIGESAAMGRVHDLVARVADGDASILIHGETGTGKELVARAIHDRSRRKNGPFVALNCAAVPSALLESELFGHAKGAFTDAKSKRTGILSQANGGTLLLDEIGELPLEMQPKLLRALQERTVRPVGSDTEIPFDARIITATNRDLEYEVFQKRFREDLFYRINVVKIDLPALRERGGDVLKLAHHFLVHFARSSRNGPLALSAPVAEKLMAYDWPGNVRELENCMERVVALARFEQVTVDDLPEKIRAYRPNRFVVTADDETAIIPLDEVERRYILRVLAVLGGNKLRAAQALGMDRRTLYRKLEQYEGSAPAPELQPAAQ